MEVKSQVRCETYFEKESGQNLWKPEYRLKFRLLMSIINSLIWKEGIRCKKDEDSRFKYIELKYESMRYANRDREGVVMTVTINQGPKTRGNNWNVKIEKLLSICIVKCTFLIINMLAYYRNIWEIFISSLKWH